MPPLQAARLDAPAEWRSIEFISDLHLCAELPRTAAAVLSHLRHSTADAIFLLGDIFEAWVGDDMAEAHHRTDATASADGNTASFEHDFSLSLAELARTRWIGFMVGNRDFLVGPRWLANCGLHAVADPTLLLLGEALARQAVLLSHGDRLCLADADYQRFRVQVRSAEWQQAFLARPLPERLALARQMRQASQLRQAAVRQQARSDRTADPLPPAASPAAGTGVSADPLAGLYADVDHAAALAWLREADATTLLHGHTHRPGRHVLAGGSPELQRLVLSDWDLDHAEPSRAEVLRLDDQGWQRLAPCHAD
ncbi:MAG: UDP-2,3-diacylglucosamine hydrolase [Pseudomonadota bacterium]